ncbi:MAG: adenylate kinase [Chloroflexi bacterium]|nr:adenylate kinase [Chloroflexota bacterium]
MRLVLLGAPGAGKGTQAEPMSRELGAVHISSGDLFREAVRQGTELGRQVKSYIDRGALVPDEITVRMVMERISAPDASKGFILDGFPRTLEQARALDAALAQHGISLDGVVYINVSPEELQRRLGGRWICRRCQAVYHEVYSPPKISGRCDRCGGELYQREDDKAQTVKKRIDVYSRETAPLIAYYREADKLIEIDGEQDIDRVRRDITAALKNCKRT